MAHFLVCASCCAELVALGAVRLAGPREGSLLDRCAAHPSRVGVHATNLIEADLSVVDQWRAAEVADREAREESAEADDIPLVARLAVALLAGRDGPGLTAESAHVEQAIYLARQVVAAAKGEATR